MLNNLDENSEIFKRKTHQCNYLQRRVTKNIVNHKANDIEVVGYAGDTL